MRSIKVDEYEVVEDLKNGVFKALRHGEEWQNLVGNNFVLSLVDKIEKYEKALEEIESLNEYYSGTIASKALDSPY